MKNVFQSTLPARGATAAQADAIYDAGIFQSTLPARGATESAIIPDDFREISIHTPREGSDEAPAGVDPETGISIHTPREGSDAILSAPASARRYFNPHSPRGERRDTSQR